MQGQIWPTVTGTGVNLTRLGLVEALALTKIGNKVDLNRSKLRFLEKSHGPLARFGQKLVACHTEVEFKFN